MKTSMKLTAAGGALVLGATAAVPAWTSRQVDEQLHAWAQVPAHQSDVQLRNLQHHAGYLSSSGTAELVLRSRCSTDAEEQAGMVVQVSYQVSHLPRLAGVSAFGWQVKPQGEAAQAFKALFGTENALTGQGHVTWSRQVQSDISLPAMSLAQGGGSIEASPSRGALTVGDKRVAFSWQIDDAQLRSSDVVAKLEGMNFSMDLDNWQRGTGDAAFKVRSISTRETTLEGLSIESTTLEKDGRLDSVMRNHLDRLQAGKQELKNLAFDVAMKGMHADSVEKLTHLFSQSCSVERMTQAERQTMRDAFRTLLSQGMSLQIEKLKGESAQGSLEGDFTVSLKPSQQGGTIQMAELLTSSGRVNLRGDLASPDLRQMATAMGWGQVKQDSLASSFQYERGQLKVLDRVIDASAVQKMLALADTVILAVLEDRVPEVLASQEDSAPQDEVEAEEAISTEPESDASDEPTASEEAQDNANEAPDRSV